MATCPTIALRHPIKGLVILNAGDHTALVEWRGRGYQTPDEKPIEPVTEKPANKTRLKPRKGGA